MGIVENGFAFAASSAAGLMSLAWGASGTPVKKVDESSALATVKPEGQESVPPVSPPMDYGLVKHSGADDGVGLPSKALDTSQNSVRADVRSSGPQEVSAEQAVENNELLGDLFSGGDSEVRGRRDVPEACEVGGGAALDDFGGDLGALNSTLSVFRDLVETLRGAEDALPNDGAEEAFDVLVEDGHEASQGNGATGYRATQNFLGTALTAVGCSPQLNGTLGQICDIVEDIVPLVTPVGLGSVPRGFGRQVRGGVTTALDGALVDGTDAKRFRGGLNLLADKADQLEDAVGSLLSGLSGFGVGSSGSKLNALSGLLNSTATDVSTFHDEFVVFYQSLATMATNMGGDNSTLLMAMAPLKGPLMSLFAEVRGIQGVQVSQVEGAPDRIARQVFGDGLADNLPAFLTPEGGSSFNGERLLGDLVGALGSNQSQPVQDVLGARASMTSTGASISGLVTDLASKIGAVSCDLPTTTTMATTEKSTTTTTGNTTRTITTSPGQPTVETTTTTFLNGTTTTKEVITPTDGPSVTTVLRTSPTSDPSTTLTTFETTGSKGTATGSFLTTTTTNSGVVVSSSSPVSPVSTPVASSTAIPATSLTSQARTSSMMPTTTKTSTAKTSASTTTTTTFSTPTQTTTSKTTSKTLPTTPATTPSTTPSTTRTTSETTTETTTLTTSSSAVENGPDGMGDKNTSSTTSGPGTKPRVASAEKNGNTAGIAGGAVAAVALILLILLIVVLIRRRNSGYGKSETQWINPGVVLSGASIGEASV